MLIYLSLSFFRKGIDEVNFEYLNLKVMKTLILLILFGCLFSVNSASAQQEKDKMLPVVTITATGTSVSEQVREAFKTSFKSAEKTRWFEVNQNYLVKFIEDDQEHHALYQKNGTLIYHVTYGYDKNLPIDVKKRVKARYSGYSIERVFNVSQNSRNIWFVNLENADYLVMSRIEDSIMEEVTRSKNATAGLISAGAKQ